MKKINFEEFEMFTNIEKTNKVEKDVRTELANILYTVGSGIEMLSLAMKIYNSQGETEYNEKECELLKTISQRLAPFFIDAINRVLID